MSLYNPLNLPAWAPSATLRQTHCRWCEAAHTLYLDSGSRQIADLPASHLQLFPASCALHGCCVCTSSERTYTVRLW